MLNYLSSCLLKKSKGHAEYVWGFSFVGKLQWNAYSKCILLRVGVIVFTPNVILKKRQGNSISFLHSMNDHVEKQPPLPPTSIGLQESRLFGSMIEFSITRTLTVLNLQQKWILNIHNCFPHDFGTFWLKKLIFSTDFCLILKRPHRWNFIAYHIS